MKMTEETRLESYLSRPVTRRESILQVYRESKLPLTARQVMTRLGLSDMNSVRPRIAELRDAGKLREACKVFDSTTRKTVCAFEVVPDGE